MSGSDTRIRNEAEFQDKRVEKGGSPRKFQHLIREEYPFLLSLIGNIKNKKILTMGCATGGVTPFARGGKYAYHNCRYSMEPEYAWTVFLLF